jgi:hypothetical protein
MDPKPPHLHSSESVKISDSEYFLLQIKKSEITLMRLDLQNLTCTFWGKNKLHNNAKEVIFDCENRRNFCLTNSDDHNHWLQPCEIRGSTLTLRESVEIDLNTENSSCERLYDNRLQAFIVGDRGAEFVEYNLTVGNQNFTHQKLFELDAAVDFQNLNVSFCISLNFILI